MNHTNLKWHCVRQGSAQAQRDLCHRVCPKAYAKALACAAVSPRGPLLLAGHTVVGWTHSFQAAGLRVSAPCSAGLSSSSHNGTVRFALAPLSQKLTPNVTPSQGRRLRPSATFCGLSRFEESHGLRARRGSGSHRAWALGARGLWGPGQNPRIALTARWGPPKRLSRDPQQPRCGFNLPAIRWRICGLHSGISLSEQRTYVFSYTFGLKVTGRWVGAGLFLFAGAID